MSSPPDSYVTVVEQGEAVFRDRGSRFIGRVFPVGDEHAFRAGLEQVKTDFPAARHYCYAWRLGVSAERSRAVDDGEPSGTAGRPILSQLISFSLTYTALIVVRYFGGTLLGTGGLINAYRNAAAMAIAAAAIETRFVMSRFEVFFPDEDFSAVQRTLRDLHAVIEGTGFEKNHQLIFTVRRSLEHELTGKFAHLYRVTLKKITDQ